jgi:hypothetical protein
MTKERPSLQQVQSDVVNHLELQNSGVLNSILNPFNSCMTVLVNINSYNSYQN